MPYLTNSFLIVFLLLFALDSPALSQYTDAGGPQWVMPEHLGQPRFQVELVERVNTNPEICRLDVFVEVINDYLQFVRKDSAQFEASIDINVSVDLKDKGEVFRQTDTIVKTVGNYEETNSRSDYLTKIFTIELLSGEYTLKVLLADRESGMRERIVKDFSLKARSSGELALSQIMLMKTSDYNPHSRYPSHPLLGEVFIGEAESIFLFFDLMRAAPMEPCNVIFELIASNGNRDYIDSLELIGGSGIASYTHEIPVSCLQFGSYQINLTAIQGSFRSTSLRSITVKTRGVPGFVRDLDLAIKQLRYIATEKEIKELKEQFTSDRESAFIAFWNEKFPAEGEKTNGRMVEYYSRINYADENFSGSSAGWETDRGRILVIYGKPTEVERNVFESDGVPYEIWYYNHLGKTFTFKDEYGFGDYRLVTPAW